MFRRRHAALAPVLASLAIASAAAAQTMGPLKPPAPPSALAPGAAKAGLPQPPGPTAMAPDARSPLRVGQVSLPASLTRAARAKLLGVPEANVGAPVVLDARTPWAASLEASLAGRATFDPVRQRIGLVSELWGPQYEAENRQRVTVVWPGSYAAVSFRARAQTRYLVDCSFAVTAGPAEVAVHATDEGTPWSQPSVGPDALTLTQAAPTHVTWVARSGPERALSYAMYVRHAYDLRQVAKADLYACELTPMPDR